MLKQETINFTLWVKLLFYISILILPNLSYAQKSNQGAKYFSEGYCENILGDSIREMPLDFYDKDTIGIVYSINNDSLIVFDVINTTSDTIYIFSTYFNELYYLADCLHRVKPEKREKIISFVPIVPFLGVRTSDIKIPSTNRICEPFQVRYNFVILYPKTHYEITFNTNKIFSKPLYALDVDLKTLSKFDHNFSFRYKTIKKAQLKYNTFFEFAIYSDIEILCDGESFYNDEFNFDKASKVFKILRIKVDP